jgi:hypothetical protein
MFGIDVQEEYRALGTSYDAFERLLDEPDAALYHVAGDVSQWSPAQHLHHILVADGMMLKGIQLICRGGSRILPEGALNDAGRYVLAHGFVRGRGQAPQAVVPPEEPSRDDLQHSLDRSRHTYHDTEAILPALPDAEGYLPHGYLGELDAAQWLRLARLHSEHHLSIIRDIIDTREAG